MVHDSLVPTAGRRPTVVVAGGERGPRLLRALVVSRAVRAQPSAHRQVLYGTYLVSSLGRFLISIFINKQEESFCIWKPTKQLK